MAFRAECAPGAFVAGKWQDGLGMPISVLNPANEGVLTELGTSTVDQVEAAVRAARATFDGGVWSTWPPERRAAALADVAEAMRRAEDRLVDLVVADVGCPRSFASTAQVSAAIDQFAWYAEAATSDFVTPLENGGDERLALIQYEPIGVAACIVPYNFPLLVFAWKVGAALAAGCTTVVLPSSLAPLAVIEAVALMHEAGLPPGTINMIVGGPDIGRALCEHNGVDLISFTGSLVVGIEVMKQAAANVKPVILELGGKSPQVVMAGADVQAASEAAASSLCRNSGQSCGATTRWIIDRTVADQYLEGVTAALADVHVGDPLDPLTDMGPVISDAQAARVEGFVQRAVDTGGEVLAQTSGPLPDQGYYVPAIVLGGLNGEAEVCQEEVFGPVGALLTYDSVDEAVALANGTRYGLNATVWGPHEDAIDIAKRLKSGTVTVGKGAGLRPNAPWGGVKHSGFGRERGSEGILAFTSAKYLEYPRR